MNESFEVRQKYYFSLKSVLKIDIPKKLYFCRFKSEITVL